VLPAVVRGSELPEPALGERVPPGDRRAAVGQAAVADGVVAERVALGAETVDESQRGLARVVELRLPGGTVAHRRPVVDEQRSHAVRLGLELADVGLVYPGGRLPVDPVGGIAGDVLAQFARFQSGFAPPAPVVAAYGDHRDRTSVV
jgi:hypothetical protein